MKRKTRALRRYEEGSIEDIASGYWSAYDGDVPTMQRLESTELDAATRRKINSTLRGNYIEGFRQGVLLRLNGGIDAHG